MKGMYMDCRDRAAMMGRDDAAYAAECAAERRMGC